MNQFLAPEDILREHHRWAARQATRARMIELARCCQPSHIAAAIAALREWFRPAGAACCA